MFFDHYPYTNFHNVNLDWVLQAVKAWGQTVKANDQAFKDLKEANEDFKRYVRNYLQDLDVSDEINTKLDRMLAEGTLTPYFAPYVKGYVESWLASNVTPTTPALDKTLSLDDAAANAAATGERIERAAYLRTLDGPKLCNLLNKNHILPGYRIQSACLAGGYFYVCGGSEAADGKGFIAKMGNLDFKNAEITYYTDLGHANDITYSYTTNSLYVTTVGEGVDWGIWKIDLNDLTSKTLITNCPANTIGIQFIGGRTYLLAPPRIYRTLDFETYTLLIENVNDILNRFSIQSADRISQTLVRLPNNIVGWVGTYIKEPEHIWYGFIAYFGESGAITFDVFPTYHAECQAAIWDEKSTVYVISNGTTGPAYTVLRMDCGDLKYLELGTGRDLNDYTGEGLFYLIGAATMDNCPVSNEGLTLKVSLQGLLNTRQDIYTNSGRHLYRIKLFNPGTWGEWVEQAAEIAQIKEDLSVIEDSLSFVDIEPAMMDGKYVSNTGDVASSANSSLSDWIAVNSGQIVLVEGLNIAGARALCKYTTTDNSEHSFVGSIISGDADVKSYKYTVEEGITYIRGTGKAGEQMKFTIITPIKTTAFVSTNGDDSNDGNASRPFATVSKAIELGFKNICVYGGEYSEIINLGFADGEFNIRAFERNKRVIFKDPQCVIGNNATASDGYTKVKYIDKALTLASGNIWIFQNGINDTKTEMVTATIMPQERGKRYRCEDTKIERCTSTEVSDALEEIEAATTYKWFYDDSNARLYFSSPTDVTEQNPLCYSLGNGLFLNASRKTTLKLIGIEAKYMTINVDNTCGSYLKDCSAMNAFGDGAFTYDSATAVTFERCEASRAFNAGSGDGFNAHAVKTGNVFSKQTTCYLLDCWAHDNCDDGYSDHERSETVVRGGLYEFNGKGGVTPSYGSHCSCYDVMSRNNYNGFYYTGTSSDGGLHGQMLCVNCIAMDNKAGGSMCGYRVDGTSAYNRMVLTGCKSIGNGTGYYVAATSVATLIDCGSYNDDVTKQADGTMTIINTNIVT